MSVDKVLVIGSGGREHALAMMIAKSRDVGNRELTRVTT
jgi:phosphoribosylamine-glycine ligase